MGIYIEIWDYDLVGSDDYMGSTILSFTDLPASSINTSTTEKTLSLPLTADEKHAKEEVRGSIQIQITYQLLHDANSNINEGSFTSSKSGFFF